jgi:hypothetical protein
MTVGLDHAASTRVVSDCPASRYQRLSGRFFGAHSGPFPEVATPAGNGPFYLSPRMRWATSEGPLSPHRAPSCIAG